MLTPKQKQVLEYVRQYIQDRGLAPSLRDIMNALALSSPSTVHRHLAELERKGYIERGGYHSKRSIQILDTEAMFLLPLKGTIAAGVPLEVVEDSTDTIEVSSQFFTEKSAKSRYVLQVAGDSMIDMGLLDGDYVVIEHRDHAENGEVVAALYNGGATLKEYRKTGNRVQLHPKNKKYRPINVTSHDEFLIRGVLVGSFRQYA